MLRQKLKVLFILFAVVLLALCFGPQQEFVHSGEIMGTSYTVKWFDTPLGRFSSSSLKKKIQLNLEKIDGLMSTYKPDSELSRFNSLKDNSWFSVSSETMKVLVEAKEIYSLTDGAFDPTIGPLVELWGFGSTGSVSKVPGEEAIAEHLKIVGFSKLELNLETSSIRKIEPKLQVDLSAIAKGFAVDTVAKLLIQEGLLRHMVEIGGEVRVAGSSLRADGWKIAVVRPDNSRPQSESSAQQVLELQDTSMATSGTYRNFFQALPEVSVDPSKAQVFSHVIDPKTGSPVQHKTISVSVIAKSCMRADALATGLLVLGVKGSKKIVEKERLSVLFFEVDDGLILESKSPKFENRF